MRFVLISDTHNQHDKISVPEGDVLIHSGDACGYGSFREMANFLTWFSNQPHQYKVYVPGNHCRYAQEPAFLGIVPDNINCLIDEAIQINDYKFYGSPWTPTFSVGWAFNKKRGEQLRQVWSKVPDDTNVLITHGPPMDILDIVVQDNGAHVPQGCEELAARVAALPNLKLHVFGHIHIHGKHMPQLTKINGVTFVNASQLDDFYKISNSPVVVDI